MNELLWEPTEERIKSTNMYRFMGLINEKNNTGFTEYNPLYEWSVNNITEFWENMWEFAEIHASKPYEQVVDDLNKMPGAKWFSGAPVQWQVKKKRQKQNENFYY